MSNFWTISLFWAIFLLLLGIALAAVLPPLLRRNARSAQVDRKAANIAIYHDQLAELKADLDAGELDPQQYEDARLEIEKRLSEDVPVESAPVSASQTGRGVGYALAGGIPLLAIGIYVFLGNPDAAMMRPSPPPAMAEPGQHEAAPMIAALEARLKSNPDDVAGWNMLARSYGATGQFGEAVRVYARLTELLPDDSGILADYADAFAMMQGGKLQGKPLELINKALKLNPQEGKALNLAGSAAYQAKDFSRAAEYWRSLLKLIPPDDPYANEIRAAIQDAGKAASLSGLDNLSAVGANASGVKEETKAQAGPAASISGTVSVSGDLAGKFAPGDTVFIYAQAPQGPKMPIASLKITAGQLPYRFTLDDSLAMTPNDRLSNHAEVMVSARVSKSGQAMTQSGDLLGRAGSVKPGQQDVAIVIDRVLP
ncbi:MAG: c-type cytochrome biogenesis protein CcmI [Nitrosomonadales bacterium]|nr:MAG: c-type cytochrome biogenesis protein CcmI [Nitrosomonadales bacterium]